MRYLVKRARIMKALAKDGNLTPVAAREGISRNAVKAMYYQAIDERMRKPPMDPNKIRVLPNDQAIPGLCLKMRLDAIPYRKIAERFNISISTAKNYVQRELGRIEADEFMNVDTARRIHIERIELLIHALWPDATKNKNLGAVAQITKLLDRQSKLLGLDAPAKIDISSRLMEMAKDEGLTEEEAMKEVEAILQQTKARGMF